jgi:hypothetical protein
LTTIQRTYSLRAIFRRSSPLPVYSDDACSTERSPDAGEWHSVLEEFVALGGLADNIALGRGSFGRGLFPQDPSKPFLLRLPDNLLFPVENVEFVDDGLRVKKNAGVAAAERSFFERYQRSFSWGGGGRRESANLIALFDSLPSDVRVLLSTEFDMQHSLEGSREDRMRWRFLHSRMIEWNRVEILMPLVELANYSADGCGYGADPEGHLQIQGHAPDEILVNYGRQDSFDIFRTFGFATARSYAYSRPMTVKVGPAKLAINCTTAGTKRAGFWIPEMKVEGGGITLSHLMIGNARFPRLSRGIFYALMRDAGASGAEQAFDLILHANKTKFLHLLEVIEPRHGEMITMLRRTAHFQLEAMTNCVGTRDL